MFWTRLLPLDRERDDRYREREGTFGVEKSVAVSRKAGSGDCVLIVVGGDVCDGIGGSGSDLFGGALTS